MLRRRVVVCSRYMRYTIRIVKEGVVVGMEYGKGKWQPFFFPSTYFIELYDFPSLPIKSFAIYFGRAINFRSWEAT